MNARSSITLPAAEIALIERLEVLIDQSRAIDNRRFRQRLRPIPPPLLDEVKDKLRRLADLA